MTSERIVLDGDIQVLLSHMVLWGLAAICEDMELPGILASWSDTPTPQPILHVDASKDDVAQAVIDHATRSADHDSWLSKTTCVSADGKRAVALAAPRTAAPANDEIWRRVDEEHCALLDDLESRLDQRLLLGFGYRSWWAVERSGKIRADFGCNAWEMRTRNNGTDVVKDRLLPLAREVQAWSISEVLDGLTGTRLNDVVGKNDAMSHTGTGFCLPQPVDNARAWCALWGLANLPVMAHTSRGVVSPALLSASDIPGQNRRHLVMFGSRRPMTLARARAILRSSQLPQASAPESVDAGQFRRAVGWCRAHGVDIAIRFPVDVVGSASAPERRALHGQVVPWSA